MASSCVLVVTDQRKMDSGPGLGIDELIALLNNHTPAMESDDVEMLLQCLESNEATQPRQENVHYSAITQFNAPQGSPRLGPSFSPIRVNGNNVNETRAQSSAEETDTSDTDSAANAGPACPYRGLNWEARTNRWRVKIKFHQHVWYLGYFQTDEVELAAEEYDVACLFLNRPDSVNFASKDYAGRLPKRGVSTSILRVLEQQDPRERSAIANEYLRICTEDKPTKRQRHYSRKRTPH
jgi:hypothetical protein